MGSDGEEAGRRRSGNLEGVQCVLVMQKKAGESTQGAK